jgi:hypothetical protein
MQYAINPLQGAQIMQRMPPRIQAQKGVQSLLIFPRRDTRRAIIREIRAYSRRIPLEDVSSGNAVSRLCLLLLDLMQIIAVASFSVY